MSGLKRPGKTWLSLTLLALAIFSTQVKAQNSSSSSQVSGNTFLEPYQSIEVSSINTGIIKKIHVKQGDFVKAGQVLVTLDSEIIEAQYQVAKARAENSGLIMAAKAERDQQSHRYNQLAALKSRGHSGVAEMKREYAMLQAAEGNLIAAREDQKIANLDALRIRAELNQRLLKTPIDGYVVSINRDVAEPVGPGAGSSNPDDPDYLVRIVQISRLKATAFLPHTDVKRIKVGSSISVASAEMNNNWSTQGTVEFISPIVFAATGLVEVRVAINNYDLSFKSGIPVQVIIP